MIIDHNHPSYKKRWSNLGADRYNGAYYYSCEIGQNIIPAVDTDRNWITINMRGIGCDHSIVFVHNNKNPRMYEWLKRYEDLILVCGVPMTVGKVSHLGRAIYLPLSVDVEYVEGFRKKRRMKDTAFVGRKDKMRYGNLPEGIDCLCGMKREDLLKEMARYKRVYAVGRTAIEAKILGAEVLPYDDRFPDPRVWQIVDNRDAAVMLQKKINDIEKSISGTNDQWWYDPEDFIYGGGETQRSFVDEGRSRISKNTL